MNGTLGHPTRPTGPDRFAQARALRRRWARDAALLGTVGPDIEAHAVALGSLPHWVALAPAERIGFAVLTGAVLRSRRLRRTVDGAVLTAVASAIGEERLDAVMALPERVTDQTSWRWAADPVSQLHALGGEVLLRGLEGSAALSRRLAAWFPVSDRLAEAELQVLRRIETDAWMLWSGRHGAGACPGEAR
jgi:hypothetical protein